MKSEDLIRHSHSVKVYRNNRQAVTRHLNEMDKQQEEERLQGATVSIQRQTAAASTSTLGEGTIEIQ
jgi:hypothetical protein